MNAKRRFSEAQIIDMIKEQEAGLPTAVVCCRSGISPVELLRVKARLRRIFRDTRPQIFGR
ncbi:MAG: transposase [Alphaproteobacteria bacterium]|nr:transposase [Alphaproteobacteria bacterium]